MPVQATTIGYVATDLPDVVPSEDLWRYTYQVSGATFSTGYGFSIRFDHTLFESLESPPPQVGGDWNIISLQPDVLLPDDGLYDALALVDGASLASPFTVEFNWMGSGRPGAQPFVVYDDNFAAIEAGVTVPEPSPLLLLLAAVAPAVLSERRPLLVSRE